MTMAGIYSKRPRRTRREFVGRISEVGDIINRAMLRHGDSEGYKVWSTIMPDGKVIRITIEMGDEPDGKR